MAKAVKKKLVSTPVTFFTRDVEEAIVLANADPDGQAMTKGPGTLNFHGLIAQHGAGEFTTLYCPIEMVDMFMRPAGSITRYSEGIAK